MPRRKANPSKPYGHNENIHVYYELEFGRDLIKSGDPIKFKGVRGVFKFLKWAHNSELDVTWIDVMDIKDGQFRSFEMQFLKGVVRAKKSRRKKIV